MNYTHFSASIKDRIFNKQTYFSYKIKSVTQTVTKTEPKVENRDEIVSLIYEELEKINLNKIILSENTDMTKDLNIDSLAVMDLMFALEERFDVYVPLNDLADIHTVKQLADKVENILKNNN